MQFNRDGWKDPGPETGLSDPRVQTSHRQGAGFSQGRSTVRSSWHKVDPTGLREQDPKARSGTGDAAESKEEANRPGKALGACG